MPDLSDDLADRLASFGSDTAVTLPGATAARSRGRRRTRRARAALGVGAASVVAAAALVGASLGLGDQDTDRVSIPAAEPPDRPVVAALLDPDDLAGVLGGTWTVQAAGEPADLWSVLGQPCAQPAGRAGLQSAARALVGDGRAAQVVTVHADEAEAMAAHYELVDAIEQCADAGGTVRLVGGLPGTSATRSYGETTGPGETSGFALEQRGRVLTAVSAPSLDDLPALVDRAGAELDGAPLD